MTRRRLRLIVLAYGISLFIWLSVEDVSVGPVILFGLGAAFLTSVLSTVGKLNVVSIAARYLPILALLLGGLNGALTSVMVVALMFFKNSRHAHIFADYPPEVMVAILRRGPVWALAGGLIGLSVGLGWLAWRRNDEQSA